MIYWDNPRTIYYYNFIRLSQLSFQLRNITPVIILSYQKPFIDQKLFVHMCLL